MLAMHRRGRRQVHNADVRVLVVEDDDAVGRRRCATGCPEPGSRHAASPPALRLWRMVSAAGPDFVLLDLGLPDMDGTDVCRAIRARSQVPIIVVSARSEEIDRVVALEMGADDYVVKPFGMHELVARIRAVVRRIVARDGHLDQDPPSARSGALTIDRRAQRVHLGEREVHLTAKEFDLLCYLAEDPGAVYRRSEILRQVWGANWYGTAKTVDAHVAAIRKKLGDPRWIEAVRGVGFRIGIPE